MPTSLDPLPPGFRLIAHRGASVRAPENTAAAFRAAYETGSREVETDVQLTSDGVAILCHDKTLVRYGHGDRHVEACSYGELAELDFGSWFDPAFSEERVVRLSDFLAEFSMLLRLHIELKGASPTLAAATLDLAQQYGAASQSVFTSFSFEQLERARAHRSQARLGWLVTEINDEVLGKARELGLFQICPKAGNLTADAINRALEVVPEVRAWGCPRHLEEARLCVRRLQSTGCSGITIDEPLWIDPGTLAV
ncbi:MAG TPA: glycerophosphodiester phosphodiesterase family protein [Chthoniobacteraceae bacterium]|nr:glycerophosphodiester phosphodiesterase family protein [Chthoniobacteraceae bacterium]